jgi:GxxExxY protein
MTELLHKELTGQIIGVYYDVYNGLSQTYPEFVFEKAMMADLRKLGIPCVRQDKYEIRYKDWIVGRQELDIFVAQVVVVEIKVAERIEPIHLAQLLSYLKTVSKEVGLLLRFGGPEPEFERRVLTQSAWGANLQTGPPERLVNTEGLLYPEMVFDVVGGLIEVFKTLGPGFVHRIYANACYRELRHLCGLDVLPRKEMQVYYRGQPLTEIKFTHIQVEDKLMVFPVAIGDINNIRIQNLKNWMRHLKVPLGILANFQDTRLRPMILRV